MQSISCFTQAKWLKTWLVASVNSSASGVHPPPRLLDQVRATLRLEHYSGRTETAYIDWIKRFILFHGKRHPSEMGAEEVRIFLTHLAREKKVAASTQNQALSALIFLYRVVLKEKLPWVDQFERVQRPPKVPVVFTQAEARAVLARLNGTARLMGHLLYGSGLRLMARKSFAHVPGSVRSRQCFTFISFDRNLMAASI